MASPPVLGSFAGRSGGVGREAGAFGAGGLSRTAGVGQADLAAEARVRWV